MSDDAISDDFTGNPLPCKITFLICCSKATTNQFKLLFIFNLLYIYE